MGGWFTQLHCVWPHISLKEVKRPARKWGGGGLISGDATIPPPPVTLTRRGGPVCPPGFHIWSSLQPADAIVQRIRRPIDEEHDRKGGHTGGRHICLTLRNLNRRSPSFPHTTRAALIPRPIYETLRYPKGFMSVLPSKSGEGRAERRDERRRDLCGVKSLFYFRVARPEPLRGGRPHLRKERA